MEEKERERRKRELRRGRRTWKRGEMANPVTKHSPIERTLGVLV